MKLPLVDEIRAAREAVAQGQDALGLRQRLKAARVGANVLSAQVAAGLPAPDSLPDEGLIAELAQRFPELAQLPELVRATDPLDVRLARRLQQLDLAEAAIAPLAVAAEADAATLHELQHQQRHALEAPVWAQAVAELVAMGAARDELLIRMAPLRQQASTVAPVIATLAGFLPHLQSELVQAARTEDPDGVLAWRAAVVARSQHAALGSMLAQLQLPAKLPVEPSVPDAPAAQHRRRLRAEAGAVHDWMSTLDGVLSEHGAELDRRLADLEAQLQAAEAALVERMG